MESEEEARALWAALEAANRAVKEQCKLWKQREVGKLFGELSGKLSAWYKEKFRTMELGKKTALFRANGLQPALNELGASRLELERCERDVERRRAAAELARAGVERTDGEVQDLDVLEEAKKTAIREQKENLKRQREDISRIKNEEKQLQRANEKTQDEFRKIGKRQEGENRPDIPLQEKFQRGILDTP